MKCSGDSYEGGGVFVIQKQTGQRRKKMRAVRMNKEGC
jgi:hypothetical protein